MPKILPLIDVGFSFGQQAFWGPTSTRTFISLPQARVRDFSTSRGRNDETGRFEAGTGQCTLTQGRDQTATEREVDPFNTSSPYFPDVEPSVSMRVNVGENPVPNPCMEQPIGSRIPSTTGWGGFIGPGGSGLTVTAVRDTDGGTAPFPTYGQVTALTTDGYLYASPTWTVPATPGEVVNASAWVKGQANVQLIYIFVRCSTAADAYITDLISPAVTTNLGSWQRISESVTLPATTAKVAVYLLFQGPTAPGTVTGRWTGVQLVRGAELQPFVSKPHTISVTKVEQWNPWETDQSEFDWVARPQGTDALATLAELKFSDTRPEEASDTRIGAVLDQSLAVYGRIFSPGASSIQANTFDRASTRGHIDEVVDTEGGRFFANKDNDLVFMSRDDRLSPYDADRVLLYLDDFPPGAILTDERGPFPLAEPYESEFSNRRVKNDWYGQRANGGADAVTIHMQDVTSYSAHDMKSEEWNPILPPGGDGDGEIEDGLYWRLFKFRYYLLSVNKIVVNPQMDARLWDRILPIDIGDQLQLALHFGVAAGTSPVTYWVEAVKHSCDQNKRYRIEFAVSPADGDFGDYLILGDASYGQLDAAKLGY